MAAPVGIGLPAGNVYAPALTANVTDVHDTTGILLAATAHNQLTASYNANIAGGNQARINMSDYLNGILDLAIDEGTTAALSPTLAIHYVAAAIPAAPGPPAVVAQPALNINVTVAQIRTHIPNLRQFCRAYATEAVQRQTIRNVMTRYGRKWGATPADIPVAFDFAEYAVGLTDAQRAAIHKMKENCLSSRQRR